MQPPVQLNHAKAAAGGSSLQRKIAKPQNSRGGLATRTNSSTIQRAKRDYLDYELDYVIVPDNEMKSYAQHVRMRTKHFFIVVLGAVLEMKSQGGTVGPGMFTDTAKAQEATGFRLGQQPEDKLDAAHLMNTTLVPKVFKNKNQRVADLYRASAATTTQFQKANVGPDKLIDTQQTKTKNAMLASIQGGAIVNEAFISLWVTSFLQNIANALTVPLPENKGVSSQSRAEAFRTAVEEMGNVESIVREIIAELPK